MSYLARLKERERAKTQAKGPDTEPTKPTKPSSVSFVSTNPARFRQDSAANEDTEPAQDLPLLDALAEFDALIDRLAASGYDGPALHDAQHRMSPDAIRAELPIVRRHLEEFEHPRGDSMPDNRRTCEQCTQLTSAGRCMAAARGEIAAARFYFPQLKQPMRCAGYRPDSSDPDQRPATERWPGIGEK
jgi:hypothetical protein